MLIDARNVDWDDTIETDVCIIGAGAAGITLARALRSERRTVCVLEGGGLSGSRDSQSLYEGESEGPALNGALTYSGGRGNRNYLWTSRLRYFGGSTNHWAGFCRPLDDLDFANRPWVPHSGWPITKSQLAPYYEQAADVVQIQPFDNKLDEGQGGEGAVILQSETVATKRFHFSPPTRFGAVYRRELATAERVNVLLNANATDIETNEGGSRVSQIRVATLGGRTFAVRSKVFVLATGGIENARLLLVSDSVQKAGLGNQHDLVGRFFMDHPHVRAGVIVWTDPFSAVERYGLWNDEDGTMAVLCLSEHAQRTHELLNVSIAVDSGAGSFRRKSSAGGFPLAIGPAVYQLDRLGEARLSAEPTNALYSSCFARTEASPNPESRVTLDRDVDAHGVRRAKLAWKLTDLDRRSIWGSMELVARELATTGRGRVLLDANDSDPWRDVSGGAHHMGTTRMSDDPTRGVVDGNGRVHGVSNLYIAGSSVFPTVGFANPTLTIVALALRLADHLPSVLEHA